MIKWTVVEGHADNHGVRVAWACTGPHACDGLRMGISTKMLAFRLASSAAGTIAMIMMMLMMVMIMIVMIMIMIVMIMMIMMIMMMMMMIMMMIMMMMMLII